jgi:pentalenic acid synthase
MTEPAAAIDSAALEYPMARTCPYGPPAGHERMRAEAPLSRIRLFDGQVVWFVTGHAEARAVLGNHRGFSSDRQNPSWPILVPRLADSRKAGSLVGMDPPEHTEHRKILIPSFTVKRVAAMREGIGEIVTELIDGLLAQGPPVDLVAEFTQPLTSRVLCRILGAPYSDYAFFEQHSRRFLDGKSSREEAAAALTALGDYIDQLLLAKQEKPGEGLLDDMLAGRTRSGAAERRHLVGVAMTLLIAGYETTANTMGVGILALLAHPEQLAAVRDGDAALRDNAVEEVLRLTSVVDAVARFATEDTEVGGQLIRAGDGVVVALAQGNRDSASFDSPDSFDVRRSARGHLSFGYGVHQCVGQNLARAELDIAFTELFRRIPGLRLTVPADEVPMKDPGAFHGVTELPVAW